MSLNQKQPRNVRKVQRAPLPQPTRMKTQAGEAQAYRSVRTSTKSRRQMLKGTPALRILSSMTLPKESEPVRVGSAFGSDPTATAKLFRRLNVINGSQTFPSDIPNADTVGFAFRDALRSMIYSFGLNSADGFEYSADFALDINTAPGIEFYPRYEGPLSLNLSSSTVSPHGENLYFGRNGKTDQHRGIFATGGPSTTLSVIIPPIPLLTTGIVQINLWRFLGDVWASAATYELPANVGGTANMNLAVTGYYSITFSCGSVGATISTEITGHVNLTQYGASSPMTWAQLPLPNVEDVLPVVRAYRITSVSLMLTNTASPLNRQGQIVGIQLPKESDFLNFLDFDEVASDLKSQSFSVVNGMYGFLKPTSPDDFDMRVFQYIPSYTFNNFADYVFDLIPESDYLLIHSQVVDPNGRQGYWTPAYNVEYESISQWSDLKTSDATQLDLSKALTLLPDVPQWHENDFHFSDIWDWIKDTASSVWSGIKEIAPVALAAAPLLL